MKGCHEGTKAERSTKSQSFFYLSVADGRVAAKKEKSMKGCHEGRKKHKDSIVFTTAVHGGFTQRRGNFSKKLPDPL
jgi:hypothetical protein